MSNHPPAPFHDKVVFISGAASGMGKAAALAYAQQGAKLALLDINEYALILLVESLECEVLSFAGDISDEAFIVDVFAQIDAHWHRVDVAFNNAGYGVMRSVIECTSEQWDQVQNINLKGTWLCVREQLKLMYQQGSGAIVNNASVLGLAAAKGADAAYCVAKHGVVGLTKMAALESAEYGVRVNCICPASVNTPMLATMADDMLERLAQLQPIGRIACSEEVIAAVLWLSSEQASYMTGVALPVDGGVLAGINMV
ncbi:SDR family oxidoreductase [Pseudoalteromonas sp. MMG013]|uniref:SDR family NAD(P)-dependent oxidoreductase n=1 Tax=Pseudoalteromonas sp. MMG013 TaxID=2822687 RepID=UPI001B36F151|nr:SDR family oxidoreductase [Pseudoalteromonas sp. MMG013]MBQ4863010.1 SDR family oxidoreductase [Pseudoalteromonas sp. MMG013]